MPDDETIATILAICNLMGSTGHNVNEAVQAYQSAMGEVLRYRQSQGLQELGGVARSK